MKTCKSNNCSNPVFSHDFCKFHQWQRTDEKARGQSQAIRRPPISKVSKVQQAKNNALHRVKQRLISINGHTCFFCGGYANDLAHIFNKNIYPEFYVEEWGLILACRLHHNIYDDKPWEHHLVPNIEFIDERIQCVKSYKNDTENTS